ncbi:MAG: DUF4032 domain-containing protein [Actinomycetota bacterium]
MDYTIDKVLKNFLTPEQSFLKRYVNADFPQREAKHLSERIVDHKWYVSERLKRDVGFRVAAIDYVENFYEPGVLQNRKGNSQSSIRQFFTLIWRMEFLRPKSL